MTRWHKLAYTISICGFLAVVVLTLHNLTARVSDAEDASTVAKSDAAAAQKATVENKRAAQLLAAQVERRGGDPVVDPNTLTGLQGLPGTVGATGATGPAPSATQVAVAVASYCGNGACRGLDGTGVTPNQVAVAVSTYCNARGECSGPRGAVGGAGTDGSDGQQGATGPPGPGPSDAQVAAAVSDYCSGGQCRGPEGPQGQEGPRGTAQPGQYQCGDGEYVQGFVVATDGSVSLTCRPLSPAVVP